MTWTLLSAYVIVFLLSETLYQLQLVHCHMCWIVSWYTVQHLKCLYLLFWRRVVEDVEHSPHLHQHRSKAERVAYTRLEYLYL